MTPSSAKRFERLTYAKLVRSRVQAHVTKHPGASVTPLMRDVAQALGGLIEEVEFMAKPERVSR